MTAQTPVYGLKYIVEGEPARNARAALEDNAKSIEAALLLGGVAAPGAQDVLQVSARVTALEGQTLTPTMSAGWTNYGSGLTPLTVWRSGKTAFCTGLVRNANAYATGAMGVIATLPTGWRPAFTQVTTQSYNGVGLCRVDVEASGNLTLNNGLGGSIAAGMFITVNTHWRLP